MFNYLLRRILLMIPVLLGVATLTFFLIHFVPGDPIDIMLGDQASNVDKAALRTELGLDQPLGVQYKKFLLGLTKFDLGKSLYSKKPVASEIGERLPATMELAFAAVFISMLIGIPLGVLASIKQYGFLDNSVLVGGLLGMSLPGFWTGPMMILIFSIYLDIFPVSGRGGLFHVILPAVCLGLSLSAILMRMTRASMLEVNKEDYIRTAISKGVPKSQVLFKHALRNALIPIITIVGLQFGALLTGTVITETIFDWPGIGSLFYEGIQQRNYPVVQGCVLFISFTYVTVNLLTDLAYAIANPRVRLS
ncbi:MAG: nickel ABC transporter permease [Bdellovibrionota bacterium]